MKAKLSIRSVIGNCDRIGTFQNGKVQLGPMPWNSCREGGFSNIGGQSIIPQRTLAIQYTRWTQFTSYFSG